MIVFLLSVIAAVLLFGKEAVWSFFSAIAFIVIMFIVIMFIVSVVSS